MISPPAVTKKNRIMKASTSRSPLHISLYSFFVWCMPRAKNESGLFISPEWLISDGLLIFESSLT